MTSVMTAEPGIGQSVSTEFGEPFTQEWRLAHAHAGDVYMARMLSPGYTIEQMVGYSTLASAHYAAANVRARPQGRPAPNQDWLKTRPI